MGVRPATDGRGFDSRERTVGKAIAEAIGIGRLPGLDVDGIGEVALPVSKTDARRLIKKANQAPYVLIEIVASGQFTSEDEAIAEALRLLRQTNGQKEAETLPADEWQTRFQKFLDSIPQTRSTSVDVSRESIYEGRGE